MFLDQPLNYTRVPRVSRTPLEADPVQGPYRPAGGRLWSAFYLAGCLASFAALGVLLAWRV